MKITDLAVELCQGIDASFDGVTLDVEKVGAVKKSTTHITNARGAKKIGRPIGTYCNIEVDGAITEDKMSAIIKVTSQTLGKFIAATKKPLEKLLVVGLGNSAFVADSLGPKTVEAIIPTDELVTFAPGVLGSTGIPSPIAIKAIADATRPSHILVVDTLCCHERERLGNNLQLSDTGITPGSGVARNNQKLDSDFLGVPTIAAGVPLVIYEPELHYVVPKTIDVVVTMWAQIIAEAIAHIFICQSRQ